MSPTVTVPLYLGLVVFVAALRLVELGIAQRHAAWLRAAGAVESGAEHYPWMVALHTAFLISCPLEVVLLERPFVGAIGLPMLLLFLTAMALRYWVIRTLGRRWTTRVLVLPGAPPIEHGPYRLLRHPNYVAVAIEIVALPLVHGAWLSALVFSLANAWLLTVRIRVEDRALGRLRGGGGEAGS